MCFLKALKRVSRPLFSIFFLWILPLCHVSKYIEVQPRGASDIFAKAEWRVRTIVRLRWTIWTGNELAMSHWTGNGLATSKVIWQWKAEITQRSRDGTQGARRKLESFRAKPIGPRGPQMRPNPIHTFVIARPGHAVLILVLNIVVSFGLEYSFVSYPFRNIRAFQLSAFLQYLETETEFKNFAFCYVFSIRSPYITFLWNSTGKLLCPSQWLKVGGRAAATPIREEVAPTSSRKLGLKVTHDSKTSVVKIIGNIRDE